MKHKLQFKTLNDQKRFVKFEIQQLENDFSNSLHNLWAMMSAHRNHLITIHIKAKNTKRTLYGEFIKTTISIEEITESEIHSKRFSRFICLLRLLYCQFQSKSSTTVRDIFYSDVQLFTRQACITKFLTIVSLSLNLLLCYDFHVSPSAKGLIWGGHNLEIVLESKNNNVVFSEVPMLIPMLPEYSEISLNPKPDIIILFEKDAVFHQFCSNLKVLHRNVLALTGKGFPDRNSQLFLNALYRADPQTPILAFVDADIYGLEIFWHYANLLPETSSLILAGPFLLDYSCGWLALRDREWRLMINFLKRKSSKTEQHQRDRNWKATHRELTRGLLLFKKAEMNVLKDNQRNLNSYLWRKIAGILRVGDLT